MPKATPKKVSLISKTKSRSSTPKGKTSKSAITSKGRVSSKSKKIVKKNKIKTISKTHKSNEVDIDVRYDQVRKAMI